MYSSSVVPNFDTALLQIVSHGGRRVTGFAIYRSTWRIDVVQCAEGHDTGVLQRAQPGSVFMSQLSLQRLVIGEHVMHATAFDFRRAVLRDQCLAQGFRSRDSG